MQEIQRVMVIRCNPEDQVRSWLWNELRQGRLRQGWGLQGMQLKEGGKVVEPGIWCKRYSECSKKIWNSEPAPQVPIGRYRILINMTLLQQGDTVVVPKMPSASEFTIITVNGTYVFDTERGDKDYGHIIPIDEKSLKTISYTANIDARLVVKKFRGYQAAVSNVWDTDFLKAIQRLMIQGSVESSSTTVEIFENETERFVEQLLYKIRRFSPRDLEELVEAAFTNAGYVLICKNKFDCRGGDADSIFTIRLPLVSDILERGLTIFVQVKQKTGKDSGDTHGVEQLLGISEDKPESIKILVSTSDEFSEECQEKAQSEGVLLISGRETARMLMKYLQ